MRNLVVHPAACVFLRAAKQLAADGRHPPPATNRAPHRQGEAHDPHGYRPHTRRHQRAEPACRRVLRAPGLYDLPPHRPRRRGPPLPPALHAPQTHASIRDRIPAPPSRCPTASNAPEHTARQTAARRTGASSVDAIRLRNSAQNLRRRTRCDNTRRHVSRDNAAGTDNAATADGHPGHDLHIAA